MPNRLGPKPLVPPLLIVWQIAHWRTNASLPLAASWAWPLRVASMLPARAMLRICKANDVAALFFHRIHKCIDHSSGRLVTGRRPFLSVPGRFCSRVLHCEGQNAGLAGDI